MIDRICGGWRPRTAPSHKGTLPRSPGAAIKAADVTRGGGGTDEVAVIGQTIRELANEARA